jgi:hypothetical protein
MAWIRVYQVSGVRVQGSGIGLETQPYSLSSFGEDRLKTL